MAGLTLATYAEKRAVPDELSEWLSDPDRRSLVMYGRPGRGKTGLGLGLLRELAARGVGSMFAWNIVTSPQLRARVASGEYPEKPSPCWFERWSRLLALQKRTKWDEEGWFEQLEERVTVLMLDDVGVD